MKERLHVIVRGRVQGVCYRMCARQKAEELGLVGWVRNLPDGNVETVAEGGSQSLSGYLKWCREGPSYARVLEAVVDSSEATGEFGEFEIRY